MVEDAVQDHPDAAFVQRIADFLKVLVGAEPAVDLLIISGIIAVCIRFKERAKIYRGDPQLFKVGDPLFYFQNPVCEDAVILIRRSAHAQRIDLIDHAFFCPHNNSSLS